MTEVDEAARFDGDADSETRPVPAPDDISRFFWEAAAEGRLVLQRCAACHQLQYPPDVVCTYCQCEDLVPTEVSGRATLYSFVVVDRAFHPGFVPHLPYVLALVELEEQPALRMLTNVVDAIANELTIGTADARHASSAEADVTMPVFRPEARPAVTSLARDVAVAGVGFSDVQPSRNTRAAPVGLHRRQRRAR